MQPPRSAAEPDPVFVPVPRSLARRPGRHPLRPGLAAALDKLTVDPQAVTLVARDTRGLRHGMRTLRQLARQGDANGTVPCLEVEDWPEYPVRGVMLDVSRDRVPTMETLRRLIDLWAELKLNQLRLYTEHTFAYPSHRTVWQKASPITPEEAEELTPGARTGASSSFPTRAPSGTWSAGSCMTATLR